MSLKLDELRKRLMQQQLTTDNRSPEPSVGSGSGVVSGAQAPEPAEAPRVFEPSALKELPEPRAFRKAPEAPLQSKPSEAQPPVPSELPAPPAAELSIASETAASAALPENDRERELIVVRSSRPPQPKLEPVVQHELADAVAKVFEQTKAFQSRFEDLSKVFESVDRMGDSAARAFEPLRGFHDQMAQLARSFEPMRAFQQQLAQLAQTFEPMKALESQLGQLADSFQNHLAELIKVLEPAKRMHERIERLAATFDQAAELQAQFTELHDAFRLSPSSGTVHTNGLDVQHQAVN